MYKGIYYQEFKLFILIHSVSNLNYSSSLLEMQHYSHSVKNNTHLETKYFYFHTAMIYKISGQHQRKSALIQSKLNE